MSRDDQDDPAAKGETEKPCVLCFPPKVRSLASCKLPLLPIAKAVESDGAPFVK